MKIIISGGGIGGLSAALCALHFGHQVTVLERAPALGEIGAGIQLPPNAMKVFEALGLDAALGEAGFRPDAIEARMGKSGFELFHIPLAEAALARWGSPYLHIHRADYIGVLAEALRAKNPDALRLNAELVRYWQDDKAVRAQLADGTQISGDVLIGADGIHSPLRAQMAGREAPRFTGNVAWRAVVPVEKLGALAPRPTACAWMGAGRHCVTYRLRQGQLANLVGVVERDGWTEESWTQRGAKEDALADFDGWHPTITGILDAADALYRWALFDRAALATWVDGRVALLGDAAHPMLPFMAQGAAMAVEDAWVVMHQLSAHRQISAGLAAYQRLRQHRTGKAQAGSGANAGTFHKATRLEQITTYGPMWLAGKLAPRAVHARQDWLYGYDVTAQG